MKEDVFYKQPTLADIESFSNEPESSGLPEKIGAYKVESLLNKGGMSLLYLGLHPDTKEPLTVKILSKEYLSHPDIVERFLKEAAIIELADHPNIVKLYGHGRWEGGLYIAMEFIQGISLRDMILQQAMSLRRSLEIVLQISHALAHLHAHGIIHRDLKPENILLTGSGGIKVIDFGIAAFYTMKDEHAKESKKRVMGTPAYMSPEQKEDPKNVTFASDIYSLGLITYELVLGRLSYGNVHISLMPKGLQKILAKALQPNVKERYEDIVDFIQDVSTYLSSDDWKKEMRGTDYLGEINESIKEAQNFLIPKMLPAWKGVEVALASNSDKALSTVYYDFFEQQGGIYTIILAESLTTGVEGLLHMAILRGMLRSFARYIKDPKELVGSLNEEILKEEGEHTYSLSYLTLYPNEDRLSYISCGYAPLWVLPFKTEVPKQMNAANIALGISSMTDVLDVSYNFHVGDLLFLHTFQASIGSDVEEVNREENEFLEMLKENLFLSQKQQIETIFRKIAKKERMFKERPITLISVGRNS